MTGRDHEQTGTGGLSDADTDRPRGWHDDPDNPGWLTHAPFPDHSFARATGKLSFRPDGEGRAIVRMYPDETMLNLGRSLHGGAVMSFIDMAMFTGGRCAGMAEGHFVTLDCTTHFLGRGEPGTPLDAHVELVRETRSFAFLQGVVRQAGKPCYSFTGTLKRVRSRDRG